MRPVKLVWMFILETEAKVVALFSGPVGRGDADAMSRYVPTNRNYFDEFIFEATRWAVDDGGSNSFSDACDWLQTVVKSDPAVLDSVPMVPPVVVERVSGIVARWRPGPYVPGAMELPKEEASLRDELYLLLGGDLGDGVAAAGRRLLSRMWSGRIADGFVYPAVGGYLWNGNAGSSGGDDVDLGGPLIAAIYTVGDMWGRWWRANPSSRLAIDREIVNLANPLGWKL